MEIGPEASPSSGEGSRRGGGLVVVALRVLDDRRIPASPHVLYDVADVLDPLRRERAGARASEHPLQSLG